MGAICFKKESLQNYTPKTVKSEVVNITDRVKISTKKIDSNQQQCLLLFVDTQCNLQRNQFLLAVKPTLGHKLQQYLDVQLQGKCLNPGDCIIIDLKVQQIKFKHVAILCVEIWKQTKQVLQEPIEQDIQYALSSIKKKGLHSVCITNFPNELGYSEQNSHKILSRAIIPKIEQSELKEITVACLSEQKKKSFQKILEKEINAKKKVNQSNQNLQQNRSSNYY